MLKLCISSFEIVKMPRTSLARRCQKKVYTREHARVIRTCAFSVTQEINSGSNGAHTGHQISISNKSSKQVYTFGNKSIYFFVRLAFIMCKIPRLVLKKYV